jgi:type IV pilus assembly protein PilC
MATFSYTARDKTGKVSQGTLVAADRAVAVASLTGRDLTPVLVKEAETKSGNFGLALLKKSRGKVKLQDRVIFSRQFSTMVNAGVPITKSLGILHEQTQSKRLKEAITDIAKRVQGGSTLANAMAEHTDIFSPIYINMVKAGETGGILDQVLDRLATQQEKDAEIVGKVRSAMIYPAVITAATLAAFVFLMTVIVPKLAVIFESLGSELPIYTKIMLAISKFMVTYGIFLGIALAAGIFGLFRYYKTPPGRHVIDTIALKLPILGPIVEKVNIARFARTFGSLLASGIPVLDALKATSSALSNSVFQDALASVAQQVKNGKSISDPIKASKHFPPIVAQMAAVGEETGQLDVILIKLADFYEKEVDAVVDGLTSIIEPILIIVLGAMVGAVVISVFGPISNLSTSVHS